MTEESFDLEEQQDLETEEEQVEKLDKQVYKAIKSQKRMEKHIASKEETTSKRHERLYKQLCKNLNIEYAPPHKATFTRKDNENCYVCDNCGEIFKAEDGSLIYKKQGEYAYCPKCLKILYPKYVKVNLPGTIRKTDYRDNHCDTYYSKGFK